MAALGHTSTPFCFVFCQYLSFFPGQVHIAEVSFDDVHPVLPRSSWFSLVTSQFPVCCLTRCSRVVHSQDVYKPSEPSFFNYIVQFPWTSFLSNVFISDLIPPCNPQQSPLELMWAASSFFFILCDRFCDLILHHTVHSHMRWQVTYKAAPRGWYSYFSRCFDI